MFVNAFFESKEWKRTKGFFDARESLKNSFTFPRKNVCGPSDKLYDGYLTAQVTFCRRWNHPRRPSGH